MPRALTPELIEQGGYKISLRPKKSLSAIRFGLADRLSMATTLNHRRVTSIPTDNQPRCGTTSWLSMMAVSLPIPPQNLSEPLPPIRMSLPPEPHKTSFPVPPSMVSLPPLRSQKELLPSPQRSSLPDSPRMMSSPAPPLTLSLSAPALILSLNWVPSIISLPPQLEMETRPLRLLNWVSTPARRIISF